MKNRTMTVVVVLGVLAATVGTTKVALAATLTVERDGSGDYATIQPALDAAATGDTILIGPGDYTEYSMVRLEGYAWDVAVFAYSELPDLTIIGAGAEQTVIGPAVPMLDYSTYSAKCLVWINGAELHLHGVTIRNCYEGLHAAGGSIDVDGCKFHGHQYGILWQSNGAGGQLHNIDFASPAIQPNAIFIHGAASGVFISEVASRNGGRLYFSGAQGVVLDNCDLEGSVTGISCVSGSNVTIRNSYLHGASNQQIDVYDASCSVENCLIEGGYGGIVASSYSTLTISGSVISGSFAAIGCTGAQQVTVHGSHILRSAQWAVWADGPTTGGHQSYDLSNNYWGTSSAADIATWIWDSHDSTANWGTVIFQPFSAQEVSTEPTSWGDLKALFR
jgi:hypothetical protein